MKIGPPSCWICGAEADSAEHRIKKADLVRAYGKGPYKGPSAPVHVRGSTITPIQGPRAKKVKYSPSLCAPCNSTRTQPYDRAYDQFMSWVLANEETVLRERFIDFAEVYGAKFERPQCDLFKYFVKSLGCRLVDAGASVPLDLVTLLPKESFRTALKITFSVNEDILLMPKRSRTVFIGKGDLIVWKSKSDPLTLNAYTWDEHTSWLMMNYWYARPSDGGLGSTWIANTQFLYLGSFEPLSPEDRVEHIEKCRNYPEAERDT